MKVLIAEDDRLIRNGLSEVFQSEGYDVIEAFDGKRALELFREHAPQLVCLDIMMPHLDGYEVCREIRKDDRDVPIVFITAKSEEIDKVSGLDLGADDYIVKPFGINEVVARVRAILRRCQPTTVDVTRPFQMGDLEVLPARLCVKRDDEVIELSQRDVRILQLLFRKRGEAVDRSTIFHHVWGVEHLPNSRSLDQHISQLRKRIERDPASPQIIQTVHGVGYRHPLQTER